MLPLFLCVVGVILTGVHGVLSPQFSPTAGTLWSGQYEFIEKLVTEFDMNGDGFNDIVGNDALGFTIKYLTVDTAGNTSPVDIAFGGPGICFAVGDFNGDGAPDVITGDSLGVLTIFTNTAGGTVFIPNDQGGILFAGGIPTDIAVGDFNADGLLDFTVVTDTAPVYFCLQQTVGSPLCTTQGIAAPGRRVVTGYLNNDSILDVLIYAQDTFIGFVQYFLGNGDGTFAPAVTVYISSNFLEMIHLGDLNGDGLTDIVYCMSTPGGSVGYLRQGAGFTFTDIVGLMYPNAQMVNDFVLQDIDPTGLGLEVIAGSNAGTEAQNWWYLQRTSIPSFVQTSINANSVAGADQTTLVGVLDVNRDGFLDAIGQIGSRGYFFLNNGIVTPSPTPTPTTATPTNAPTTPMPTTATPTTAAPSSQVTCPPVQDCGCATCKEGFFLNGHKCESCSQSRYNCSKYVTTTDHNSTICGCEVCDAGYYLWGSKCVPCDSNHDNCELYYDNVSDKPKCCCKQCKLGFNLWDGICKKNLRA